MKRPVVLITILFLMTEGRAYSASPSSEIRVDSRLRETYLDVRGPARVAGAAPLPIADLPSGEYRLTVDGPGLPQARGRFLRTQTGVTARAWAGPETMLYPPGLIHLARGESRGWIFLGMGMASGTMSAISAGRVSDAESERSTAAAAYASAVSERDIRNARIALEGVERKRDDRAEIRNLWIGALVYTWAAAGIEGIFLTSQPEFTSTSDGQVMLALPRADGLKAGLRSAIIPGAGQRFMGNNRKAAFFTGASAALAIAAIATHDDFLSARRAQAEAQSRFLQAETDSELSEMRRKLQEAADDTDEKNLIQWSVIGTLGGLYIWNVIDAFDTGHQAGTSGLSIAATAGANGDLKVGASWSFQ